MEFVLLAAAVVLLAVLALEVWLSRHLARQHRRLALRIDELERHVSDARPTGIEPAPPDTASAAGLAIGVPAPAFRLPGLYGESLTLESLRASGLPVLLVFTDPGCGPCNRLLPEIGNWQREYAGKVTVALISRGAADENRAKSSEHGLANVLLQPDREVAEAYRVTGTPAAVVVRPDGTVGSGLAAGAEPMRRLLAATTGESQASRAATEAAGSPARTR